MGSLFKVDAPVKVVAPVDAPMILAKKSLLNRGGGRGNSNKECQRKEEIQLSPLLELKLTRPEISLSPDEKIEIIDECITAGSTNAEKALQDPPSFVMVMGNTGAGKSTLINYISGCRMIEKKNGLRKEICVDTKKGKPPVVAIGHSGKSATFLPPIYQLPKTNLVLVDNPGFLDNRGAEINIANAVNIVSLMSKVRSISFLLCIEYTSLTTQRGASLQDLSTALTKMFPHEVLHKHSSSFMVCVSKTPPECNLAEVRRELIDQLAEIPNFPTQIAENVFAYNPTVGAERNQVLKRLKTTPTFSSRDYSYNPPLTDTDKVALTEITEEICERVEKYLEDDKQDDALSCIRTLCHLKKIGGDAVEKLMKTVEKNVSNHFKSKTEVDKFIAKVLSMDDNNLDKGMEQIQQFKTLMNSSVTMPFERMSKVLPGIVTSFEETKRAVSKAISNAEEIIEKRKEQKKRRESKPESPSVGCIKKDDTTLSIKWNVPPSYTEISKYELGLDGTITSVIASDPQYTFVSLSPGKTYDIKVRAVNGAGAGDWSHVLNIETTSTPPSNAPRNIKVFDVEDNSFKVSWEKPTIKAGETDIISYVIKRGDLVIYDKFKSSGTCHYVKVKNLRPNKAYKVSIQATNLAGTGPKSVISKTTSDKIGKELKEKKAELKQLDTNKEIVVHTQGYDKNTSDIFSCTHMNGSFNCDYKISKVAGPYRCWTFVPTINQTGCTWRGNSQTNGRVIGNVTVHAKKCDANAKKIKELKEIIKELENKAATIVYNAYD